MFFFFPERSHPLSVRCICLKWLMNGKIPMQNVTMSSATFIATPANNENVDMTDLYPDERQKLYKHIISVLPKTGMFKFL